jgi:hypothetical protein
VTREKLPKPLFEAKLASTLRRWAFEGLAAVALIVLSASFWLSCLLIIKEASK